MWKMINGKKSNIGFAMAAVLKTVVEMSDTDGITWETKWVVVIGSAILLWTGVSIRHAITKSKGGT